MPRANALFALPLPRLRHAALLPPTTLTVLYFLQLFPKSVHIHIHIHQMPHDNYSTLASSSRPIQHTTPAPNSTLLQFTSNLLNWHCHQRSSKHSHWNRIDFAYCIKFLTTRHQYSICEPQHMCIHSSSIASDVCVFR